MRRSFIVSLIVLIVALVSAEDQNLKPLKNSKLLNEALRITFPASGVKQSSNGWNNDNGTKCSDEMTLLQEELTKGSLWALKMIDASSKIPTGVMMGNLVDLGMFDECMEVNVNASGQQIRGRHCMYNLVADLEGQVISEILSVCLPASCGPENVEGIVKSAIELARTVVSKEMPIMVRDATCSAVDPPEWTVGGILTIIGLCLLLLFLIVCTIYEIYAKHSNEKPPLNGRFDILRQFSLYSNALSLLSTKTSPGTLPVLQGLRFFSMCWVIIAHTHLMTFLRPTVNLLDVIQWTSAWNSLYIMVAPFSVDTFFAISGFLMSYIFLKDMSTGRGFNLFSYYLHRYLRLTPALGALLLITIFIVPRLGTGALWDNYTNFEIQSCERIWWPILLYLHNYVKTEDRGCVSHTWYLAVEMQFFWISPLILYPLAKKPKIGLGILAAFFVASVVTPVIIGYNNEYSTAVMANRQKSLDKITRNMDDFYYASHIRAAPWLIGVFFGYLIFTQKGSSASKATKWIGWLLAIAAFSFCVLSIRVYQNIDYEYDFVWESIYTTLVRPLWGFAVSWIMYASIRGFGGPVSTLLSLPIYIPLTRISYCVYLVHSQIQFTKARAMRTADYFSPFDAFDHFLSDFMLSIIAGFFFSLVFETPILVLEKIMKKRGGQKKDNSKKAMKVEELEKGIDNSGLTSS